MTENYRKVSLAILMSLFLMSTMSSCRSHKTSKNDLPIEVGVERENESGKNIKNPKLKKEVEKWLGVPYRYGGQTVDGVDCSGLIVQIYLNVYQIKLYRNSKEIFEKNCKQISKDDLGEGDLVFFCSKSAGSINHVGLYIGRDRFVHASSSKGVIISNLNDRYYTQHYVESGKVIGR